MYWSRKHRVGLCDFTGCLQTIAYQLIGQLYSAKKHMPFLLNLAVKYDAVQYGNFTTETLVEIIVLISSKLDTVFLVLDGLDEVEEHQTQEVLHTVKRFTNSGGDIRCLLLSQHTEKIRRALRSHCVQLPLESTSVNADIARFIESRFTGSGSLVTLDARLQQEVKQALIQGADGSFLWARTKLEDLNEYEHSAGAVQTFLAATPGDMEQVYKEAMDRINGMDVGSQQQAMSALGWILAARRPLTLAELNEAVRRDEYDGPVSRDISAESRALINLCRPFCYVELDSVLFLHTSVIPFLEGYYRRAGCTEFEMRELHLRLFKICEDVLADTNAGLPKSPLLSYSRTHLKEHREHAGILLSNDRQPSCATKRGILPAKAPVDIRETAPT